MCSERPMRTTVAPALLAALLVALLAAAPAGAEGELSISTENERPLRGEVVRLRVTEDGEPAAGAQVVAVYRPASNTEHREVLEPVDSSGQVLWTPDDAGPVKLEVRPEGADLGADEAPGAELIVAVRFGRFPPQGLLIMVLAGILLFGGAATAFALLLRPPSHAPTEEPPST